MSTLSSLHPQRFGLICYLSPLGPTRASTAYSTNFNLLSIQEVFLLLILGNTSTALRQDSWENNDFTVAQSRLRAFAYTVPWGSPGISSWKKALGGICFQSPSGPGRKLQAWQGERIKAASSPANQRSLGLKAPPLSVPGSHPALQATLRHQQWLSLFHHGRPCSYLLPGSVSLFPDQNTRFFF